jgi:hypothetical protein
MEFIMSNVIKNAIFWKISFMAFIYCPVHAAATPSTQLHPASYSRDFQRVIDFAQSSQGNADQTSEALLRLRKGAPNNVLFLKSWLLGPATKPQRELAATLIGGIVSLPALNILIKAAKRDDLAISKAGLTGLLYRSAADSDQAVQSRIRATAEFLLTPSRFGREFAATRLLAWLGHPASTRTLERVLSIYGASSSVGHQAVLGLAKIGSLRSYAALERECKKLDLAREEIVRLLSQKKPRAGPEQKGPAFSG